MPRYELPGPGLGVGMISESKVLQDLSRGSALRPCLFFALIERAFSLSKYIYKAAALSAARTFSLRSKVLIERCGGGLRRPDCRFCKNGAKTSRRNCVSHGARRAAVFLPVEYPVTLFQIL